MRKTRKSSIKRRTPGMYQYDYVRVIGTGVVATKFEEHRALIDRRAGEGWRYVGWVPAHIGSTGEIAQLDLIFEKEVSQS